MKGEVDLKHKLTLSVVFVMIFAFVSIVPLGNPVQAFPNYNVPNVKAPMRNVKFTVRTESKTWLSNGGHIKVKINFNVRNRGKAGATLFLYPRLQQWKNGQWETVEEADRIPFDAEWREIHFQSNLELRHKKIRLAFEASEDVGDSPIEQINSNYYELKYQVTQKDPLFDYSIRRTSEHYDFKPYVSYSEEKAKANREYRIVHVAIKSRVSEKTALRHRGSYDYYWIPQGKQKGVYRSYWDSAKSKNFNLGRMEIPEPGKTTRGGINFLGFVENSNHYDKIMSDFTITRTDKKMNLDVKKDANGIHVTAKTKYTKSGHWRFELIDPDTKKSVKSSGFIQGPGSIKKYTFPASVLKDNKKFKLRVSFDRNVVEDHVLGPQPDKVHLYTASGEQSIYYSKPVTQTQDQHRSQTQTTAPPREEPESKPEPKTQTQSPPQTQPEYQATDIQTDYHFNEKGELELKSSINNSNQAQGEWKIFVDQNHAKTQQGNQQFHYTIPQDQLNKDKVSVSIQFKGQSDGQRVKGEWKQEIPIPNQVAIDHQVQWKDGNAELTFQLKDQPQAEGNWKIAVADQEPVTKEGNQQFTYTISKDQLKEDLTKVTVSFDGKVGDKSIVGEETLELNQKEQTSEEISQDEDSEEETVANEDTNNSSDEDSEDGNSEEENVASNDEVKSPSSDQVTSESTPKTLGGPLPKTATKYPWFLLWGSGLMIAGAILIYIYHRKNKKLV